MRLTVPSRLIVALAGSMLLAGGTRAQDCSTEVIKFNRDAAVFIHVKRVANGTGQIEELTGTGFVVSSTGYVLTADHLVQKPDRIDQIIVKGALASREAAEFNMSVVSEEHNLDVALLKFNDTSRQYPAILLGNPDTVGDGTLLCSVEFPKTLEYVHEKGTRSGTGAPRGYWYTDMPSNGGDSGAPVFTSSGGVVAMKVSGFERAQNLNLLVPLNLANAVLSLVPDKQEASIQAKWSSTPPPVTLPQPPITCKCIVSEAPARNSYPIVNGYYTAPQGTTAKAFNRCPGNVSVLLVIETIPNFPVPPLTVAAPGRTYSVVKLVAGQAVEADVSGSIAGTLFCLTCPDAFVERAPTPPPPRGPLNCVSDARLFPQVSPPGIPYICPAQGPEGTPCNCSGHAGVNYGGPPLPYP